MNRLDRRPMRRGIITTLTAGLTLLALGTIAPMSAQAAACTKTIRGGANNAVINVAANQKVCLVDVVQNGAVNVAPGGGLSVRSSTVKGAITLERAFTEFEFCASRTVGGAISATGGKGAVLIGDTGLLGTGLFNKCTANSIDGAVTLTANLAGIKLIRNTISGAVKATANQGGTHISGNKIVGALTCTSNDPPPTNVRREKHRKRGEDRTDLRRHVLSATLSGLNPRTGLRPARSGPRRSLE
jgi:hypothetical protein